MDFIEELTWRGMIHQMMPGTDEQLKKEMTTAYLGIDPTADSLHIGHLVGVMMLKHHHAHQVANMEAVGGGVDAQVCCGHLFLELLVGARHHLVDHAAPSEFFYEIHCGCGYFFRVMVIWFSWLAPYQSARAFCMRSKDLRMFSSLVA